MSFGVESLDPATLKKSGRRPIPQAHQREIIDHCRKLGIVTAAFYVLGFLQDDWDSIAATIDYAIDLGSTFAQFKILTPYPGTPMFKQLEPLLTETDWEKFDGYTPTFKHPNLTDRELRYLLGAAYKRFYMRPSYLANFLKIQNSRAFASGSAGWISRVNASGITSRGECADVARSRRMLTAISRYGARVLPEHRRARRGLQGPRRVHRRPPHRTSSKRHSPRDTGGAAARHRGLVRAHGVLLHSESARLSARLGDHLSGADVLGRCRRSRRVAGLKVGVRGRRSGDVQYGPCGLRARDHAEHARGRADASLRAAVRHGRDSRHRAAARPARHRRLRARARRHVRRPSRRHVRRCRDLQFSDAEAVEPATVVGWRSCAAGRSPQHVRQLAYAAAWPDEKRITSRLLFGRLQRIFIKPWVFTISMFPILWVAAWIDANPDVYLWEKIRPLDPLPDVYTERFPNVQAAIGLEALKKLDDWTEQTRAHAHAMDRALADLPGISVPTVPPKRTHVYYQYLRLRTATRRARREVRPQGDRYRDAPRRRLSGDGNVRGCSRRASGRTRRRQSGRRDAGPRLLIFNRRADSASRWVVRDVLTHAAT